MVDVCGRLDDYHGVLSRGDTTCYSGGGWLSGLVGQLQGCWARVVRAELERRASGHKFRRRSGIKQLVLGTAGSRRFPF